MNMLLLLPAVLCFMTLEPYVVGHGRLMDPPARNSMWRLGFPNPVNYNDNELYCGGRVTQWARNKGKCGVCGDPHHHTTRDHEVGGKYANGIISRQYTQGDVIDVTVHITANHKGYFEFRICPVRDAKVEVTQECLDEHVMELANGDGARYTLPEGKSNQFFNVSLRLPVDVTCKQCVIQWKYRTGNTWDKDESGRFCVGCGPQEEFYNCADVAIHPRDSKKKNSLQEHTKTETDNEKNAKSENAIQKKNEVILFTNEKFDDKITDENFDGKLTDENFDDKITDKNFDDKITDYGKKKVSFVQNMQTNKYSTWDEPEKSVLKTDKDILLPHLLRQDEYSDGQKGFSMRLGYADDGYNFNLATNVPLMFSQPSGVSYRWKTRTLNNPALEKIRRRFGYTSSSGNGDNSHYYNGHKHVSQPKYTPTYSEELSKTSRRHEVKNNRNYNNQHPSSPKTDSDAHSGHEVHQVRQPNHVIVTASPSGHHTFDNAAIKLHTQLRGMLRNMKMYPQQRDNFLRRWKLLRLRHIAAMKGLIATNFSSSSNLKQQLLPQKQQQPKMWYSSQTSSYPNRSITRSTSPFTPAPPETKEQSYHKEVHASDDISALSSKSSTTKSHQSAKQSSRQEYLKTKLPSWLVKALRLKHQQTDKSSNEYNNDNSGEITTSTYGTIGNIRSDQKHVATKWYDNYQGKKDLISQGTVRNLQRDTSTTDKTLHKNVELLDVTERNTDDNMSKKTMLQYNIESEKAVQEMKGEDESIPVRKNDEVRNSDEAESLVRYIVKLLLSRKNNKVHYKTSDKPDTRSQFNSKTAQKTSFDSTVKENATAGYSWFVPNRPEVVSAPITDSGKDERRDLLTVYPEIQNSHKSSSFQIDPHQSKNEQENPPPSVREEAHPFNGLILGSENGYSQQHTKTAFSDADVWENKRQYTNEEMMNAQRNTVSNSLNHVNKINNNNIYQQQIHATSYSKPLNEIQFQEQAPQSRQMNPQAKGVFENANDYHHVWTARAQNHQGHYNKQQETLRSPLICESLVTLGGGMDRWCTDNCNANFCPPSMCVCSPRSSTSSVYVSHRSSLPSQPSANAWQHTGAVPRDRSREGIYRSHGYNTGTDGYIATDRSSQQSGRLPLYPKTDNEGSYFKPYITSFAQSNLIDQSLITNNLGENRDKMKIIALNLADSNNNRIEEPPRIPHSENKLNKNMGRSANIESHYSQHAEKFTGYPPGFIMETIMGPDQTGIQGPLTNYQNKETHFHSSPYTGNSNINSNFQQYSVDSQVPFRFSWISNAGKNENLLESQSQDGNFNGDRTHMIKPYVNYVDPRQNGNSLLSTGDSFSQSGNYNIQRPTGQSYLGQNQFYPQILNMRQPIGQEEIYNVLKCKAIGAYAGLKHFDEWCVTTCQSTMCPLLICSCES